MKIFVVFALFVATASANFLNPLERPVHPRDFPVTFDQPQGRITNGKTANEGQFPYQVGLSFTTSNDGWWCGGSIIDNSWILTAAHCTNGAARVVVYFGATTRSKPKATQSISSSNFIQHASYNSFLLKNDISLIKIAAISFSAFINKVELPKISSSYDTYSGQKAIASGWGKISDAVKTVSPILQYATLEVIDNKACAEVYGSLSISSRNICTDTPSGTSTCSGDSGGPLVLESSGVLIGVTSFVSKKGCQSGAPAGFVRVTSFLDWIKENSGVYSS